VRPQAVDQVGVRGEQTMETKATKTQGKRVKQSDRDRQADKRRPLLDL